MIKLRDTYAHKAISQIPRLLSLQDRNAYSPTYGCFHRDYWLFKTSDFPDAVRQFGVHALALVYKHRFPGNIYFNQPKIREWAAAGLDYWARIQHGDGSFDEFYPYERGWVGPTAFTTYTSIEAYNLLADEMPPGVKDRVLEAIRKAAYFIAAGESEEDHLANHHAMACLALWKAGELLDDPNLKDGFVKAWQTFRTYHNDQEGWSREYDGVDPGYLSATVSFLSKIYKSNPDPDIYHVLEQSVKFASFFVYPNGFYAGSLGSRNTLHFYPHGFEILAADYPLAASVAEKMLQGLADGKLVPPEIMADRYVFYRVPEFLLSYLDYTPRVDPLPPLPYEEEPYHRYFKQSRIFISRQPNLYVIVNLAKGGVVKAFNLTDNSLALNDCGIIGQLKDGSVVTSQWIDPDYQVEVGTNHCMVSGQLQHVPSNKLFTPLRLILFRAALVTFGWIPAFAHFLKGRIRKALILGQQAVPVRFQREVRLQADAVEIIDTIRLMGNGRFQRLSVGDEVFVRYVPQSRYFQSQELGVAGYALNSDELYLLNEEQEIIIRRGVSLPGGLA